MRKINFICVLTFCFLFTCGAQAQQRYPTLIRSSLEDEIVILSVDKPVYFPGDTVHLTLQRNDSTETVAVTPILIIEKTILKSIGHNIYTATIPQACAPGQYRVRLGVLDSQGRRFVYETDCIVDVEENQVIEQVSRYVHIEPEAGGQDVKSALTLDRSQIRNLRVIFRRDSIRLGMGPQFVTIRTTVQLRDGTTTQTFERRVLTFRSDNDPNRDRAMLIQYRAAYGAFAAIRSEEFTQVRIHVDSLPDWSIIKINIEPDYTIKIGGYDRANSYTRYFRVRGSTIEVGFSIGIPKILYDNQPKDSLNYGNSSAMIRFYYVNGVSGNRFPVNLGIGTFGVNSPVDVNIDRGGFALSVFLDVAEMTRILGIDFIKKITAGLEFVPFFPVEKRARFLIVAQVGLAL
ncbi:MAG: hypothetical protein NTX65_03820 [Ignavibacteriales bacterium]|nr:hypothetical protein [Ignavibacteriales bacterium]